MKCTSILMAAAIAITVCGVAVADNYPERHITVIVPYPPGASGDVIARLITDRMSRTLKQSFVIDNRPGGAGIGATIAIANARPDGYTLLLAGPNHTTNVGLFKSLPYDPVKDFTPIGLVGSTPVVLVTHNDSGITSYEDLIAQAKKNPGKIMFGSGGVGTAGHLATELMMQLNGVNMLHIPYKGATPSLTGILAKQFHVMFTGFPPALPHINAGTLRPLLISSVERVPNLPNTRTGDEAGMKDFRVDVWFGMLAPAGTPASIVKILERELAAALEDKAIIEKMDLLGIIPAKPGAEEFLNLINREIVTWPKVLKAAGIEPQ